MDAVNYDPLAAPRKLLGISRRASLGEVKKAYYAKAQQWHPDVNSEPAAAQKFAALTDAYDALAAEARVSGQR